MTELAMSTHNLWKTYNLYDRPLDRLKEALDPFRRSYHQNFHALRDVSFDVERGTTLGIVGRNGSGKSTLLKILSGVTTPSRGRAEVNGKVSALLELGAGFNPELTGRENIVFCGTLMGMSHEELEERTPEILDFASIGEFIDQRVKTYSSGMYMRLAFAMATSIEPEILIVDEALSVGDMFFQTKCMHRMKSLMERGCTTVFVSHDIHAVKSLCAKVLYLEDGTIRDIGAASYVCDRYVRDQLQTGGFFPEQVDRAPPLAESSDADMLCDRAVAQFDAQVRSARQGSGNARILLLQLTTETGELREHFTYGETIVIRAFIRSYTDLDSLVCAFYIRDSNRIEVIGTNTEYEGVVVSPLKKGALWKVEFSLTNYLKQGNYSIQMLLANSLLTNTYFDWIDVAAVFRAGDLPGRTRWALVNPPIACNTELLEGEHSDSV